MPDEPHPSERHLTPGIEMRAAEAIGLDPKLYEDKYDKELADNNYNTYESLNSFYRYLHASSEDNLPDDIADLDDRALKSIPSLDTYEELKAATKKLMRDRDLRNDYYKQLEAKHAADLAGLDTPEKLENHIKELHEIYPKAFGQEPLSPEYRPFNRPDLTYTEELKREVLRKLEYLDSLPGPDNVSVRIEKVEEVDPVTGDPVPDDPVKLPFENWPVVGDALKDARKEYERELETQKPDPLGLQKHKIVETPPDSVGQEKGEDDSAGHPLTNFFKLPADYIEAQGLVEMETPAGLDEQEEEKKEAPPVNKQEPDASSVKPPWRWGTNEEAPPIDKPDASSATEPVEPPGSEAAPIEGDASSRLMDSGGGASPTDDLRDEAFSGNEGEGAPDAAAPAGAADAGKIETPPASVGHLIIGSFKDIDTQEGVQGEAPVQKEAQEYQGIDTQEQSTFEAAPQWSVDQDELLNPYEDDPSSIPEDQLLNPYEDDPVIDP